MLGLERDGDIAMRRHDIISSHKLLIEYLPLDCGICILQNMY